MKNSKNMLQILSLIVSALTIISAMVTILLYGSDLTPLLDEKFLIIVCAIVIVPLVWAYTLIIIKRVNIPKKIYLSYSSKDIEVAKIVASVLEEQLSRSTKYRFEIITADDIPFGANMKDTLKNNLTCADIIVVIVSTHYLASSWCIQEFKEINLENQTVIPLVLDSFDFLKELPFDISEIKGLYLGDCQTSIEIDERLSKLSKDLIKNRKN